MTDPSVTIVMVLYLVGFCEIMIVGAVLRRKRVGEKLNSDVLHKIAYLDILLLSLLWCLLLRVCPFQ
jgi:hypothetical protein